MKAYFLLLFIVTLFFTSCYEETFQPKPRGYYKVPLPEKKYQWFNKEGYPYSFQHPEYSTVVKDSMFFDQETENPWWININFNSLGGKVYISYKQITASQSLQKLLEDSYKMSYYHTKKADYINEPEFHTENNVHGIFYNVGGNAASAFQFYATDSHKHFLRGALYFDVTPNVDSLKPINEFLQKDLEYLIQTLKWNK